MLLPSLKEKQLLERTTTVSRGSEKRSYRRGVSLVSTLAALATLTACSGKDGNSIAKTNTTAVTAPGSGDPRAYRCDIKPNPHPGTFEECPIPDGGIAENGVPVFRYTNLSDRQKSFPFSTSQPAYVSCRILENKLPTSFSSLNGGGEYVLGGEYGGHAVAAADVFYNPSMPPHEMSYDPAVKLCSQAAIAAVTASS